MHTYIPSGLFSTSCSGCLVWHGYQLSPHHSPLTADTCKLQQAHAQLAALQKATVYAKALLEAKKAKTQKAVKLLVFEQHKADAAKCAAAATNTSTVPAHRDYSCFYTKSGTAGFNELSSILEELRLPLLKAIKSADGPHKSTVFLPVNELREVLAFLEMLLLVPSRLLVMKLCHPIQL